MTLVSNITYITNFIQYLDDDIVGKLIGLIFHKSQFYNPYSTNKELFLQILLHFERDNDYYSAKSNYLYNLETDRKYFEDTNDNNNNVYCEVLDWINKGKIEFDNKEYKINKKLNNNEDDYLLVDKCFNDLFLYSPEIHIGSSKFFDNEPIKNHVLNFLGIIIQSIRSFQVQIFPQSKDYKRFLNSAIKRIIDDKKCIIIGNIPNETQNNKHYFLIVLNLNCCNEFNNTNLILSEGKFPMSFVSNDRQFYQLFEDNHKVYITESLIEYNSEEEEFINYDKPLSYFSKNTKIPYTKSILNDDNSKFCLIGAKTVDSYIDKISYIHRAIKNLKKISGGKKSCHICNPIDKRDKHNKTPMCINCQKIVNSLMMSDKTIKQPYIVYRIKGRVAAEKDFTPQEKKEKNYERLKEYLNELNKNINFSADFKDSIEALVNKSFDEWIFRFDK